MRDKSYRYDFTERLMMSHGKSVSKNIADILLTNIPGAMKVFPADFGEDRHGTDWWLECLDEKTISVDCKIRERDFSLVDKDDLALETWSVVERQKIGWTRNINKKTDYILWFWNDTGRWCLMPFKLLCGVFINKWREWTIKYGVKQQFTPTDQSGYHSECVFVPRKVVWNEIISVYGGGKI